MKKFLLLLFFFITYEVQAASSSIAINNIAYTQISGPSGNGYAITSYLLSQCVFSSTQPPVSTVGHKLIAGEPISVDLMGAGIYLWCKSDPSVIGVNFITITPASDAGIFGNSASTATLSADLKKIGGSNYSLGQTSMSLSAPVVIASNQSPIPISGTVTATGTIAATQSGTWVVQPGNTANTTAWKVDGSSVTQPVTGTITANAGTNLNTSLLALESGNLSTIASNTNKIPSNGISIAANSSPVVIAVDGETTDASGTISVGGTAQTAIISNSSRRYFEIQNIDTINEKICFSVTTIASMTATGSMCLSPATSQTAGGYYKGTATGAISIIAPTTGHKYTLWVQ